MKTIQSRIYATTFYCSLPNLRCYQLSDRYYFWYAEMWPKYVLESIKYSNEGKKCHNFSLQSFVFFCFVSWTKRRISWMHLKLEFKPPVSSKKVLCPYVTLFIPSATSYTPCCVCRECSTDGLMNQVFQHDSAWPPDLM